MLKKIYNLLILLFSIMNIYLIFNSTYFANTSLYLIILFYLLNIIYLIKNKKILLTILLIILIVVNIKELPDYQNNNNLQEEISIDTIPTIKEDNNIKINNDYSFNIYISGIDTYGPINTKGRSDVNIIATINLKENKLHLTNTPRDYYVNINGSKDKLTHIAIYGINSSINSLEDLYNINIDYYIKINYNTLITLIDSLNGIDINNTHLDGKEVLNYSRERKEYINGDRQRIINQIEVIKAILTKINQNKNIFTYLNIVSALKNKYETNIDKKLLQEIITTQINNKKKWNITYTTVDGFDKEDYTYTYPNQKLYVMYPNYDTVNIAKEKINEILK